MKSVLIYSGGLDSTVLLYKLHSENSIAEAVSVDYGQRHKKELEYATENCRRLNVGHRIVDMSNLKNIFGESALTNDAVKIPQGSYDEKNLEQTVVPNRNMILLSIAAARAIALKCDCVAYAAHGGDHALYADCTSEFADALEKAILIASEKKVSLYRPFVNMTKREIARLGKTLGVDFNLTWSCYAGGEAACGKCATCLERLDALNNS